MGQRLGGRQAGTPNKNNLLARLRVEREADPIGKLIEASKTGVLHLGDKRLELDTDQALSVIRELRRIAVPDAKGVTLNLELPVIKTAADIDAAQNIIIAAIGSGEITAEEADKLSEIVERKRRALETVEFEERIKALEARQSGGTAPSWSSRNGAAHA
jgi:hypothetical protein